MYQGDFTTILQNPEALSSEQTEAVKSIIKQFPYFQSARAIFLKGLKNQNSIAYNHELKVTAAYTTDRSILFNLITSEAFIQNNISKTIKQNTINQQYTTVKIETIINPNKTTDELLTQQIKETDGVLDPTLFEPKEPRPEKTKPLISKKNETKENINEHITTQKPTAENILSIGEPFEFDKKETHSFNEWLKLSHLKPIERADNTQEEIPAINKTIETIKKKKKFELIDKFISTNPKIKPNKTSPPKVNLAQAQMIQPESLMTETLARIYVEQKNYKKAIQSYKILSLKYPEKSSFFAIQIKAVELLKEQNN